MNTTHQLKAHPHMALPKKPTTFLKIGPNSLSVIAEAHRYPGAPKKTCSGDFQVGFG
jgi:hypothetical protein